MKFLVKLYLIIFGKKVGIDKYGNTYYVVFFKKRDLTKRIVVYKGLTEASKVPPEWEAWLRHSSDRPLTQLATVKGFLPNLTGTIYAYKYVRNTNTKKVNSYSSWEG